MKRLRILYLGIRQSGYRTPREPGRLFAKREIQCAVDHYGGLINVNAGNIGSQPTMNSIFRRYRWR